MFNVAGEEKVFTKAICPLLQLIVLSIFVLKLHLRIDIKETSPTTSKPGKDLFKTGDQEHSSSAYISVKNKSEILRQRYLMHYLSIAPINGLSVFISCFIIPITENRCNNKLPYLQSSCLIQQNQPTCFSIVSLECCRPTTTFSKIHLLNRVAFPLHHKEITIVSEVKLENH